MKTVDPLEPILKVILLQEFLELVTSSLADDVIARFAWMFPCSVIVRVKVVLKRTVVGD